MSTADAQTTEQVLGPDEFAALWAAVGALPTPDQQERRFGVDGVRVGTALMAQ